MTEDQIKAIWEDYPSPRACKAGIEELEAHCHFACGKFAAQCNPCEVSSLIAIIRSKRNSLCEAQYE